MDIIHQTSFDEIAALFADYGSSLRGFVRYRITQENLLPFLTKKKLRILDVGGGSGPDTGWLAEKGHYVTFLEPSEKQRQFAQRRFNFFLQDKARKRITIEPVGLADFPKGKGYDVVLVHGVAMYQPDPRAFIAEALSYVRRGGLISLVEKGYYGAEARAIRHQDLQQLRQLQATRRSLNHMGQEVYSFRPEDLELILDDAHARVMQWTGVRLITDDLNLKISEIDKADLKAILEIESEHGRNPTIRGQGQMLHFIARKR